MRKTIEAMLRGYILFTVNGRRFLTYNAANAACDATAGDVVFDGFHIFKGWRRFFIRCVCQPDRYGKKRDEKAGERENWIRRDRHAERSGKSA
jgi:hypothetical protein